MPLPDTPPVITVPHVAAEFRTQDPQPSRSISAVRPRCAGGDGGEILVCAADPAGYRLEPLPDTPPETLPKARLQVSDRTIVDLQVQSAMISGTPSNRAMIGLRIGF